MGFTVVRGEDVDVEYLSRIDWVDEACYEPKYWGEAECTVARFVKNRRSFVFVVDADEDLVAGYINFFPCERGLYEDNLFACPTIRDDDITPDEVAPYRTDENHLFIISLAVHPDYQGGEVIKLLTNGFVTYLNDLQDEGYPITDIAGTAVSPHGKKALRNMLFREWRTLEDGNVVFLCDGNRLQKLLTREQYFKSYRDDLYVLIPMAEHEANLRVAHRLARDGVVAVGAEGPAREAEPGQEGSLTELLIDRLREYIAYECSNEVVRDLEFLDLGTFDFLHTTDEYACPVEGNPRLIEEVPGRRYQQASLAEYPGPDAGEEDLERQEIVIGDVRGHLVLAAHRKTHLFVLTIMFPGFPFSTTQMEDAVSFGYLKIRNPENPKEYIPLAEYLRKDLGLHGCGQAKCVDYLSNRPASDAEFQDILAAEAYNNMEVDYDISSEEIARMCRENQAQFADYQVYLSSRAIAYIQESFAETPEQRVGDFADYLFIVIMTLFQNAALAKVNIKVTNLLEADGDVSPHTKLAIDREYGKTIRFWEMQNFKYLSSQLESACIKEAFQNAELREAYDEHQSYLEHVVEVKAAITDARNGMIINVVATILAVISIEPFVIELLQRIYGLLGIEAEYASLSFNYGIFGGAAFALIVLLVLRRRNSYVQRRRM